MTKRGGPKKKPNVSSRNANEASGKAPEGSDADEILDFLYYDAARVGSFLAQVDEGGHLKEVVQGESVTKGAKSGIGVKLAATLPAVAGLTTEGAEGSISLNRNPGDTGAETGERRYDPFWTNARSFLDYLADERLASPVAKAGMGRFIQQSGSVWIMEMKPIQVLIDNPMVGKMLEASTPGILSTDAAQLALTLIPALQLGVQVTLVSSGITLWGTLRPEYLSTPPGDLMLKHGARVGGIWTMLGILDARPDADEPAVVSPFQGIAAMAASFGDLRHTIGRPADAFGVTPLLIYRRVSGP